MKIKRGFITGGLVIMFLGITLASYSGSRMPKEFPAPDFRLKDIFSDKEFGLTDVKGRPVLLYFFASW